MKQAARVIPAVALVLAGVVLLLVVKFRGGEKPDVVYMFSHWIDLVSEVAVPLMLLGGLAGILTLADDRAS